MNSLTRSLRMLLVEDHEDSRNILARLLTREGHAVTAVGSCGEALVAAALKAKEKDQAFDVVLADIGLPDGDGVDLMQTLAKQYPVTTIALTGYGADGEIDRCKEAGIHAHLLKPVRWDELLVILQRLAAEKG